jgi:hypothetical protein
MLHLPIWPKIWATWQFRDGVYCVNPKLNICRLYHHIYDRVQQNKDKQSLLYLSIDVLVDCWLPPTIYHDDRRLHTISIKRCDTNTIIDATPLLDRFEWPNQGWGFIIRTSKEDSRLKRAEKEQGWEKKSNIPNSTQHCTFHESCTWLYCSLQSSGEDWWHVE